MTRFRHAEFEDLTTILSWAQAEGWNPGRQDAEAFWQADPEGFFVAEEDGALVAAISIVNHTEHFAFLGLYLVLPEFRGRGIGYALWGHALAHAGTRTVGLDGVAAQQANYAKSGFVRAGATTRFSGFVSPKCHADIRAATETDLAQLIALENQASGVKKSHYLAGWFQNAETRTTFILEHNGDIAGFCTARACADGSKVGPLWSEDTDAAGALLSHVASEFEGVLSIDIPDSATDLRRLCDGLGLEAGFETARMYRGPFEVQTPPCFAIASMELG